MFKKYVLALDIDVWLSSYLQANIFVLSIFLRPS